jgi:hypothetical protein
LKEGAVIKAKVSCNFVLEIQNKELTITRTFVVRLKSMLQHRENWKETETHLAM